MIFGSRRPQRAFDWFLGWNDLGLDLNSSNNGACSDGLLVVVFTCSDPPDDVNRAYHLGAISYLVKPSGFSELQETVKSLENYWGRLNLCPDCFPGPRREGVGPS